VIGGSQYCPSFPALLHVTRCVGPLTCLEPNDFFSLFFTSVIQFLPLQPPILFYSHVLSHSLTHSLTFFLLIDCSDGTTAPSTHPAAPALPPPGHSPLLHFRIPVPYQGWQHPHRPVRPGHSAVPLLGPAAVGLRGRYHIHVASGLSRGVAEGRILGGGSRAPGGVGGLLSAPQVSAGECFFRRPE
jgi:hypothetical protein